jgi:hypothetical protein
MEPALEQLARPLPTLSQNAGTRNPSISGEILSLAYMHPWTTFATDLSQVFEVAAPRITHQVRLLDESEVYTVGNKFGLTGRFVRNVCDPVMKSLQPLEEMESIRFGDFQAISDYENTIPDVCFGLVHKYPETTNAYLVGEFKTPWKISRRALLLDQPNPSPRLEPLIGLLAQTSLTFRSHLKLFPTGQLVSQMRTCQIRFGFLSTYDWTVFVRREADNSFLLSPPIGYEARQPSVRELLTAFSLMALKEPKYEENPEFQPRNVSIYLGNCERS